MRQSLSIRLVAHRAKRLAARFKPCSVHDVIASLDNMMVRGKTAEPVLPTLVQQHDRGSAFWQGLARPQSPCDHEAYPRL